MITKPEDVTQEWVDERLTSACPFTCSKHNPPHPCRSKHFLPGAVHHNGTPSECAWISGYELRPTVGGGQ